MAITKTGGGAVKRGTGRKVTKAFTSFSDAMTTLQECGLTFTMLEGQNGIQFSEETMELISTACQRHKIIHTGVEILRARCAHTNNGAANFGESEAILIAEAVRMFPKQK